MMAEKRIVCFGDSNTWGFDPSTGGRYDEDTRWTMRLGKLLGSGFRVIEEGQNGRTLTEADPSAWASKSAADYALPMIESHRPFELLIIMLGTNDLKREYGFNASDIARCLKALLGQIRGFLTYKCGYADQKILVVSPVYVGGDIADLDDAFEASASGESKKFAALYRAVADEMGCEFLDAAQYAGPAHPDDVHLSAEGHLLLAEALAAKIKDIL